MNWKKKPIVKQIIQKCNPMKVKQILSDELEKRDVALKLKQKCDETKESRP